MPHIENLTASGFLPSQNLEAEQAVLGAVILDETMLPEIRQKVGLESEDFYSLTHRICWKSLCQMSEAGLGIDTISFAETLMVSGVYDQVDGDNLLHRLVESTPHSANAVYHAEIVKQKAITRNLEVLATTIIDDCRSNRFNSDQLTTKALEEVTRLVGQRPNQNLLTMQEVLEAALDSIQKRMDGVRPGISTGFPALDSLTDGFKPEELTILAGRPSMGKAQPMDAKILTPSGFRKMGSIAVGDEVIGSSGRPCRVVGVFPQGERYVYRVTTSDGGSTECCEEHLWFTQTRNERRRGLDGSVKTLGQIAETLSQSDKGIPNHAIPVVRPVEFAPSPTLAIHPYVMGLLLGDGSFGDTIRFSNPEADIQESLRSLLPGGDDLHVGPDGKECRIKRLKRNRRASETHRAVEGYGLSRANSLTKFIPPDYMKASIGDRMLLLRGLMDTDGFVTSSGTAIEYSSSSHRLARDVISLARSLGGIVSERVHVPVYSYRGESYQGAESHRIVIRFPGGENPVSSRKHLAKWKGHANRNHKTIVSVEPVGFKDCQCIKVDAPNSLYVTDDYIVTHNTAFMLQLVANTGLRQRHETLIRSMEQSEIEIGTRLILHVAGVPSRDIQFDDPDVKNTIATVAGRMVDAPIHFDRSSAVSIGRMCSEIRWHHHRFGTKIVFIDYLQLISGLGDKKESRQEQVAEIARALKALARDLKIPVIALAQLNRELERREDKRPRLGDLRESGAIEQDADVVMFLHRPDYYKSSDQPGRAEVIVAKNRNGATGTVNMKFTRDPQVFEVDEMDTFGEPPDTGDGDDA
jgi:replicative DNA helicase